MWPDARQTEDLLAEVRGGDDGAVNELLDRHRDAVRRMIDLRMDQVLKRRVDASDIVQEVLIDASRRLRDYLANPVMPFHLWLRQMAKDRLIDAHRRHRQTARRSMDREQPLAAASPEQSSINLANQLRDQQLTPAAAAAWAELQRRFETACAALDEQDQEIVLMRHFEHLANSEAAASLGLSPQAASMRYLRAMRRLRQLLEGENGQTSAVSGPGS
jgi:RNA polymerase sigma-70 factor, ECF subfamily